MEHVIRGQQNNDRRGSHERTCYARSRILHRHKRETHTDERPRKYRYDKRNHSFTVGTPAGKTLCIALQNEPDAETNKAGYAAF